VRGRGHHPWTSGSTSPVRLTLAAPLPSEWPPNTKAHRSPQSREPSIQPKGYNSKSEDRPTFPSAFLIPLNKTDAGLSCEGIENPQIPKNLVNSHPHAALSGPKRFPFSNFTYYFTLSSECFSPFPYGHCSLSSSRQYCALDGAYHPFRNAIPNIPTR